MENRNTHTVIGLFDNRSDAQAAMNELIESGFIRENIDLSNRSIDGGNATGANEPMADDQSAGGGIANFFSSLFGGDSDEATRYSNAASESEAILTIQTDSQERATQASEILDRNDAVDVDERNNQRNFAQTGETNFAERSDSNDDVRNIPVIEEDLQVGKRTVESGGVRIRSRVVERPVEESVRLRTEHVVVDRHPVNRAVSQGDLANFQEENFELTEHSEEAVIGKQARVTEEVSVGKNVTERDETIKDTVRHTEVDVEQIGEKSKSSKAGLQ